MSGEANLQTLLAAIRPEIRGEEYVFVTVSDWDLAAGLDAVCAFRESEAVTVICPRVSAERAALGFEGTYRHIPVAVHSSLEAVGFLAAMAAALAGAGIPCNAVSAFYHDHLFVPSAHASRAVEVLQALAARNS